MASWDDNDGWDTRPLTLGDVVYATVVVLFIVGALYVLVH